MINGEKPSVAKADKYALYAPHVSLVWHTVDGDRLIAEMARVSVKNNKGKPITRLIQYLADNKHFSPFQMCNMCLELHAPRDITRQILRHASFTGFQEFSGRYAEFTEDSDFILREPRLQHTTNRQMSVELDATSTTYLEFMRVQEWHIDEARRVYSEALASGIAREQARSLLPEGNTLSRMYLNGSVRTWLHYFQVRCDESSVQREHVEAASLMRKFFCECFPIISSAFFGTDTNENS